MQSTLAKLGIDRMTVAEKLSLIGDIWESVAKEVEPAPLTQAQREEVDRRLAAHQANPEAAIPWETIQKEALARLQK